MADDDTKQIINEYSKEYCLFLEATYGKHMMSEGGTEAIDNMLNSTSLDGKRVLDIGFGLGGTAFYIAEQYDNEVHGIEINPWLVAEATRRTPNHLSSRIKFHHYQTEKPLPFSNESFDIVLSKGVLSHLRNKYSLFKEVHRISKATGHFIIDDWISAVKGRWGKRIQHICEAESLTLYPETVASYLQALKDTHFKSIACTNKSSNYIKYNQQVISRLQEEKQLQQDKPYFQEIPLDEAINNYQFIKDAIKECELLIYGFKATK